ncbi:hypothetical protein L1987_29014 [Smallanthus sonchifolius]|uniref:Uncharacterized protein n=1 Tax=Smallanthus sonchifolius TaxID=185202 RepID=A0ACB9HYV1_9ASTR|nr:hypothetical protein L1987_29014 [Smallanthus sonchifolius]
MRNSINDEDDSFDCRVLNHLPVDSYIDLEDSEEEEDESNLEMVCPYCSDGFDALGLCVHLEDQHPLEIKLGRKLHDDESFSILSLIRKKLQEHSRNLQKESASITSSTNSATDPLLFSFVSNAPQSHESQADSSAEPSSSKILPNNETLESNGNIPAGFLSSKDHEEKAQKTDFMQTILLSTIFTDNL